MQINVLPHFLDQVHYLQSHLFYSIGDDPKYKYKRARDWRIPSNFDAFELFGKRGGDYRKLGQL